MGSFAHGATISIGGTAIGQLQEISLPDETRDEIETTHHGSTGQDEFVAGLRRGGSVNIAGNFVDGATGDTGQTALRTNYAASGTSAIAEIIISFNDNAGTTATTFTGDGFVTALGGNAPHDDKLDFSATLKCTGGWTFARATGA